MPVTPRFSDLPLPPYRFIQHETPHPTQHVEGHFHDKEKFCCTELGPNSWRGCAGYLFALDLFNHRYFWECHEVLEDLWACVDHASPTGHHLQGFIQCTVAHWHARAGHASATTALLGRIPRHAEAVGDLELGIALPWLLEETRRFAADPTSVPALLLPAGL